MGSVVLAGATSGSTTITPTDAVTATVTLPSTGGTLQTSGSGFTTNGVAYASSTSALATGSALTWSGTLLSATTNVNSNANVLSLINSNTAAGGCGVGIVGYSSNGSNSLGSIQFGGAGSLGGNLDFSTANSSGTNTLNMRLSSSGQLGIGTSSPSYKLDVSLASSTSGIVARFNSPSYDELDFYVGSSKAYIGTAGGTPFAFQTNNTEAMRIDTSQNLLVGTTSAQAKLTSSVTSAQLAFYASQDVGTNGKTAAIYQTVSGGNGSQNIGLVVGIQAQGNADRVITAQYWNSGSPQDKFYVQRDGSAYNSTGVYGTISDGTLKQDIVDATSQWDDIKNIKFRKYRMIADVQADPNAPHLLGVVAQELEESNMHGLVETPTQEDGTKLTKQVKLSVLQMKGMKALQEAMIRIEEQQVLITAQQSTIQSLTDRITALENK